MTNEQLVYEIQQGNDRKKNLEKLYMDNRGLIARAARRFTGFAEIDDLMQEGYIALQEAADKYDSEGGASFASYAYKCIYGKLLLYLRDHQQSIHISPHMRDNVLRYKRINEISEKTTGEAVTLESAAVLLGVNYAQASAIIQTAGMMQTRSLSDPLPGTDDMTLGDSIPDQADRIGLLMEALADQKVNQQLWECVDSLGARRAKILHDHYQGKRPLSAIAEDIGVSLARVAQEHAAALRRLRGMTVMKRISEHYNFYSKTSSGLFHRTWTSQPEFYVMRLEEMEKSSS